MVSLNFNVLMVLYVVRDEKAFLASSEGFGSSSKLPKTEPVIRIYLRHQDKESVIENHRK